MSGIHLTTDNVQRAKDFLLQYLRDAGYAGSLEDGTGIYDVVIKAFGLMYSMLQEQTDKASGFLSLKRAEELKDVLGVDYDDAVDSILSNWFVTRKEGLPTAGTLRLWFTSPTSFLHLTPPEELFKYEDNFFTVQREYIISDSDFDLVRSASQNIEEYFIDVDVVSLDNVALNVKAGERLASYINNVYFIRAEALSDFETGKDKESSEEFISRTSRAITTRELISVSAIKTVLTQEFATVTDVYVAGHGSTEQIRDIVQFDEAAIHVGNKADIYVRSLFTKATATFLNTADGSIGVSDITPEHAHICYVFGVYKYDDDGLRVPVSYTLEVDETTWLTAEHNSILHVSGEDVDTELEFEYLYSAVLPSVSDLVTKSGSKVTCYDPFVKSMHPVILSFNFRIVPFHSQWQEFSDAIKNAVQEYILGLGFTESYTESALLEHIHNRVQGIEGIEVPIGASFTIFDEKQQTYLSGDCGSHFSLPALVDLTAQLSSNTVQFYTDHTFIDIQ